MPRTKVSISNASTLIERELDFDYAKVLAEYLNRGGKKERNKNTIHASEIGYCLRKTYFQILRPKPIETELMGIFELGTILHEKMTQILQYVAAKEGSGIKSIESEQRIILYFPEDDFRISGFYDDLVTLNNGKRILIEKKSIKNFTAFNYDNNPKPEHVMQISLYAKALMPDVTQIVYISKENLAIKTFEIIPSIEIVKAAVERAKLLNKCLIKGILPPKETGWACEKYCDYAKLCKEGGK
jgi:hypothetical protein